MIRTDDLLITRARTFIEELDAFLPGFYADVDQHLKNWVPATPKLETANQSTSLTIDPLPQATDGGEPE